MKAFLITVLAIITLLFTAEPVTAQQPLGGAGRDPQFEQLIYDRLAKINPAAVQPFIEATAAWDAENYSSAESGFRQVLILAPDFPDALRRLAVVESSLQNDDVALQYAQKAHDIDPSPDNATTLAMVLMSFESPAKYRQAYDLALEAYHARPTDPTVLGILAMTSWAAEEKAMFKTASTQFLKVDPQNPLAHFFNGISATIDGNWELAKNELELSVKLGMDKETVEKYLDSGIRTQAMIYAGMRWGGTILVAWLVCMGILFLVGLKLSSSTLDAVRRQAQMARFEISPGERRIRQIYRAVILMASAYFFISIPILVLLLLALAAGFAYLILSSGSIPVRFVIYVAIAILVTLLALLRSLFVRVRDVDPGRQMAKTEEPYLWQFVTDVARKMNTRPVDIIFVTPGVDVAVWERGKLLQKLKGSGKRCLVLGLGVLKAMNQGEFQAVLAHEYGHFLNKDTAGGNLAAQVRTSMFGMGMMLAGGRQANWLNPAWLFVSNYYKVFSRIILGASRLQEILADRYAALCYGAANLKSGLVAIIRQNLMFDARVGMEIERAKAENRGLTNLYALKAVPSPDQLENKFQEISQQKSGPYESHPSMKERFEYIDAITGTNWVNAGEDHRPAWDLLSNGNALEQEMTQLVEKRLRDRNILQAA